MPGRHVGRSPFDLPLGLGHAFHDRRQGCSHSPHSSLHGGPGFLNLLTDIALRHLRLAAHRPALVGSRRRASFDGRFDLADREFEEHLRHCDHRVGQPVGPFRVRQLRRQLDGLRPDGRSRLLGKRGSGENRERQCDQCEAHDTGPKKDQLADF